MKYYFFNNNLKQLPDNRCLNTKRSNQFVFIVKDLMNRVQNREYLPVSLIEIHVVRVTNENDPDHSR